MGAFSLFFIVAVLLAIWLMIAAARQSPAPRRPQPLRRALPDPIIDPAIDPTIETWAAPLSDPRDERLFEDRLPADDDFAPGGGDFGGGGASGSWDDDSDDQN